MRDSGLGIEDWDRSLIRRLRSRGDPDVSKYWRLRKCLIPRNISCSSKTRPLLREAVAEQLTDRGYQVEQADIGEAALARLAEFAFDIIVTDLRLPGIDGSAVVEAAVERYPDIIAIVVTGYGTVKDAVEAIKRGACGLRQQAVPDRRAAARRSTSALEQRRLKSENAYLRAQLEERYRFEGHRSARAAR